MSEQILWLARDKRKRSDYEIHDAQPSMENGAWTSGVDRLCYCRCFAWSSLFSGPTLEPGQCAQVKLTQTPKGIRLERL